MYNMLDGMLNILAQPLDLPYHHHAWLCTRHHFTCNKRVHDVQGGYPKHHLQLCKGSTCSLSVEYTRRNHRICLHRDCFFVHFVDFSSTGMFCLLLCCDVFLLFDDSPKCGGKKMGNVNRIVSVSSKNDWWMFLICQEKWFAEVFPEQSTWIYF